MGKIIVITPEDAAFGFRLAGAVHYVSRREDLEKTLLNARGDPDAGIAIIDERLLEDRSEENVKEIETMWKGIFIVLPSPVRRGPDTEDYAARLIRRAIGYHMRVQI